MGKKISVQLPGFGLFVLLLFCLSFYGTPSLYEVMVKHYQECK